MAYLGSSSWGGPEGRSTWFQRPTWFQPPLMDLFWNLLSATQPLEAEEWMAPSPFPVAMPMWLALPRLSDLYLAGSLPSFARIKRKAPGGTLPYLLTHSSGVRISPFWCTSRNQALDPARFLFRPQSFRHCSTKAGFRQLFAADHMGFTPIGTGRISSGDAASFVAAVTVMLALSQKVSPSST